MVVVKGIVGYVDLWFGECVCDVLEVYFEVGCGWFCGVWYLSMWDVDLMFVNLLLVVLCGLLFDFVYWVGVV